MREYARISPLFWTRGSGKLLRGNADAQVVAMYLVTCPNSNMVGIYYLPLVVLAYETGLSQDRVSAALTACASAGFAYYDPDAEMVWVPNMVVYQAGSTMKRLDKRRALILSDLSKAGRHPFVAEFYKLHSSAYSLDCPIDSTQNTEQAMGKLVPITDENTHQMGKLDLRASQEQEKEQEQEQELLDNRPSQPAASKYQCVFDSYIEAREQTVGSKGAKPVFTPKRQKLVRDRVKAGYSLESLQSAARGLFLSEFHVREKALDFEYALRETNLDKFIALYAEYQSKKPPKLKTRDTEEPEESAVFALPETVAALNRALDALPKIPTTQEVIDDFVAYCDALEAS